MMSEQLNLSNAILAHGVPHRPRRAARRGLTLLLVLMLISIALGSCYAIVRAQVTAQQLESNSNRAELAEQAAMTGLAAAIRKMHETAWGGVGSSISGTLSSVDSYAASYTAGDASLTSASPSYSELPYRVTINVTGTSTDPNNSAVSSTYPVAAVVKLIPRAVGTSPSIWPTVRQMTVYQLGDTFYLDVPCRVEGPLRVQGAIRVGQSYSWNLATRQRYLGDLNTLRQNTSPSIDLRPVTGPITTLLTRTDATNRSLLTSQLGVTLIDSPGSGTPSMMIPAALTSYRVYTGGPSYTVGAIPATLQSTSLNSNPATNPLGIYFRSSAGTIGNDVNVNGTLIYYGDVTVSGTNVNTQAASLPALYGSTSPVRLPVTVANTQYFVNTGVSATVDGVVLSGGMFTVLVGPEDASFALTGRAVCSDMQIRRRNEWHTSSANWDAYYAAFTAQLSQPNPNPYFPIYMWFNYLRNPVPKLTVKPATTSYFDHWQDLANPIFVPAASDVGLRWELVSLKAG